MKREWNKLIFELTGEEGALFKDFYVQNFSTDGKSLNKPLRKMLGNVHFFVQVVGLVDERAPKRNWGKFSKTYDSKKRRKITS